MRPWSPKWNLFAIGFVLGPLAIYAISILGSGGYLRAFEGHHTKITFWYWLFRLMVLYTGLYLAWLWLTLKVLCHIDLRDLTVKRQSLKLDLFHGVILAMGLVFAVHLTTILINLLFYQRFPGFDLSTTWRLNIVRAAQDPSYLVMWMTLETWLVVSKEELVRIAFIYILKKLWVAPIGNVMIGLTSATLFGLCHMRSGMTVVVSMAVVGGLQAVYYMRFGRPLPLVIAHVLYNTYVIASSVLLYCYLQR